MQMGTGKIFAVMMVLLLLLAAGCEAAVVKTLPPSQYDTDNPLTVEQMQKDLDYLEDGLEYYHTDAWHSISKADFEAAVTEVESRLEGMTRTQFQYEVSRLVALIGDAHTSASLDARYGSYRRELPFGAKNFDDGWYIISTDADHKDILGWRINKIGNYGIEQVVERVKPYFSSETEAWTRYRMCSFINNWDLLYIAGVVNSETVTLTLSKDGKTKKVQYTAMPHPDCYDLMDTALSALDGYKPVETGDNSAYYRYVEFEDMLFVQYNVCNNNSLNNMEHFVSALNKVQTGKNYKNLVVDLRFNSGGNSEVSNPLLEFINSFTEAGGNFYLMIGEKTYSSGMLTMTYMRRYNPIIIGSPTGGGENHYGNIKSVVELKNSGVRVACSTTRFQMLDDPAVASAMPDIVVKHTFDDYYEGIDPELEIVKKLISGELAKPERRPAELLSHNQPTENKVFKLYPWAGYLSSGFTGYIGGDRVIGWLKNMQELVDPLPMAFAKEYELTPEELVAVMRYDTALRAKNGEKTEYYTEEDIQKALVYVFGSDKFDESAVPEIDFNVAYDEIWSLYGTEPVENIQTLNASIENAIPWSFVTEVGIKYYLEWANGLSDRNEYTMQNFLKHFDISVFAYDDIFNCIKQAGESFYSDEKIAEIRTEVYGY